MLSVNSYVALFIVLGLFAVGDAIGIKSRAKVSSVFVILMTFLALFLAGILPKDIIDQAGLSILGKYSTPSSSLTWAPR